MQKEKQGSQTVNKQRKKSIIELWIYVWVPVVYSMAISRKYKVYFLTSEVLQSTNRLGKDKTAIIYTNV